MVARIPFWASARPGSLTIILSLSHSKHLRPLHDSDKEAPYRMRIERVLKTLPFVRQTNH